MTPERRRTVRRLAISGVALLVSILAFLGWACWLLLIEGQAVAQGGDSTISRVVWGLWAEQPWVLLLVNNVLWFVAATLSSVLFFLLGHMTAQSNTVYEDIREGKR
jgi:hypothetical protein